MSFLYSFANIIQYVIVKFNIYSIKYYTHYMQKLFIIKCRINRIKSGNSTTCNITSLYYVCLYIVLLDQKLNLFEGQTKIYLGKSNRAVVIVRNISLSFLILLRLRYMFVELQYTSIEIIYLSDYIQIYYYQIFKKLISLHKAN